MAKILFSDISIVDDTLLKYAVIVSRYRGRWVYCKHRERESWEIPGGRREFDETILATAQRELFEETGALDFTLTPICTYCVADKTKTYGILCYAEINVLGKIPESEIECIDFFDDEPEFLTYPLIQLFLFKKVRSWLEQN